MKLMTMIQRWIPSATMKNKRVLSLWSVYALFVALAQTTAAELDDDARQRQRHQRHQQRYPDSRHLARLMREGHVNERFHIVFEKPNGSGDKTSLSDSQIIAGWADQVGKLLEDLCTECQRTFRHGGKFEEDHIAAGLDLHYDCECPSTSSSSSADDLNDVFASNRNIAGTTTKGKNTLMAIDRITEIIKGQEANPAEVDAESLRIATVEVSHAIQTTEFKGEVPLSSPINERDHPVLWARQQRLAEQNKQQHRRRELQNSQDPGDDYYKQGKQPHYAAIQLSSAWEYMNSQNGWQNARATIVHVQDTGWDLTHPDSGANKWINSDEICGNGKDDDGNGFVDDCYGYNFADKTGNSNIVGTDDHGSHVIGTIAANTDNNGVGVAGVAGGAKNGFSGQKGVSIMTGVVFGKTGSSGHAESIVYAADNGAHISSHSWSYTEQGKYDSAVQSAIDYAVSKGVLVVVAAGNNNSNKEYYPAAFSNVLAVSATDNEGRKASFTNYGTWVDIAAPGVKVYSTGMGNNYKSKSGTSMACPHVSAVLAMGKSLKPSATASEMRSCLLNTAENIEDSTLGKGMVNPEGFLKCLTGGSEPTPTPPVTKPPTEPSTKPPTQSPIQSPNEPPTTCGAKYECGNCNSARDSNSGPGCSCPDCQARVCAKDPWCCDNYWDGNCAQHADFMCACHGASCGTEYCTISSDGPGCASCPTCEEGVCGQDSFCCDGTWDGICANLASKLCPVPLEKADCGTEACTVTTTTPGCKSCPACEELVCAKDSFCCAGQWDDICVNLAKSMCVNGSN